MELRGESPKSPGTPQRLPGESISVNMALQEATIGISWKIQTFDKFKGLPGEFLGIS
jgi:hypothetical protein